MNQTHASQGSFYPGVLARVEEYGENGETFPNATRVWHKATFKGEERTFATHVASERWLLQKKAELATAKIYLDPSVEDRRPDATDLAYEDQCARACGLDSLSEAPEEQS